MATRTVEFRVYDTDGAPYTTTGTPPTTKVRYWGDTTATPTPSHIADGIWQTTTDDTKDATVYWSGTGIAASDITILRIPLVDANVIQIDGVATLDGTPELNLGRVTITTGIADEGALTITNTDETGYGILSRGSAAGLVSEATATGGIGATFVNGIDSSQVSFADGEYSLALAGDIPVPSGEILAKPIWTDAAVRSLTDKANFTLTSAYDPAKTAAPTTAAIADAVWDEALATHPTGGSTGKYLIDTYSGATQADLQTRDIGTTVLNKTMTGHTSAGTFGGLVNSIDDYLDTEVAAIKAKTDNLPTDPADQSAVEAAITAATSLLALESTLATVSGNVDSILVDTGTDIPATLGIIDLNTSGLDIDIASILEDTGTVLDGKVDAILAQTTDILEDTSTTLDNKVDTVVTDVELVRKVLTNKSVDSGSLVTVYDDDNTTPIGSMTWTDSAGARGKLS